MALNLFVPAIAPSTGSSVNVLVRKREVSFGDGYEQRAEDGTINNRPRVMQWTWPALTESDADTIVDFLSDNAVLGFRYTLPGDVERNYKVGSQITIGYPAGELRSVSVDIKEIFDLL